MAIIEYLRVQWDRTFAGVAALLGVVILIIGYIGVSGTGFVAAQMPYIISGGLGGISALIIACTAWISADLRDEWRELHALQILAEEGRSLSLDLDGGNGAGSTDDATDELRAPADDSMLKESVTASSASNGRRKGTRPQTGKSAAPRDAAKKSQVAIDDAIVEGPVMVRARAGNGRGQKTPPQTDSARPRRAIAER